MQPLLKEKYLHQQQKIQNTFLFLGSGHYVLLAMPKGSTQTLLGAICSARVLQSQLQFPNSVWKKDVIVMKFVSWQITIYITGNNVQSFCFKLLWANDEAIILSSLGKIWWLRQTFTTFSRILWSLRIFYIWLFVSNHNSWALVMTTV